MAARSIRGGVVKQTGAQILWEALVREGVTDVFGYPGGAILPAYDAPAVLEAFDVARSGRPGPVLVDITKDAQQGSCEVDWDAAASRLTEAYDDALPGDGEAADAIELINAAERPLILAGHGVML